ncbi:hypothetical protein [Streptomyces sp. NPDC055794]
MTATLGHARQGRRRYGCAYLTWSLLTDRRLPREELLERRLLHGIHEALTDVAGLLLQPVRTTST